MITMRRQLLGLGFVAASSLLALHAAQAMSGPTAIQIDGGPLGALQLSGGVDGYAYYDNPVVSGQDNGANIANGLVELQKTDGILQFTIEVGSNGGAIGLGSAVGKLSQTSINTFSTGPLYAGYLTVAPTGLPITISAGQIGSLEGYESGVDWNNPSQIVTDIFEVQNSQSRGISANYTAGPLSATVEFGDGFDDGVFNFVQALATYTINSSNVLNVYYAGNLGRTGLNAITYGNTAVGSYGANFMNSQMIGAFYSYTLGNLNLVPEAQFVYAKADAKSNIFKPTSNFGVALFGDYSFGTSPYSVGGWAEYFESKSGAIDNEFTQSTQSSDYETGNWFAGPNSSGIGIAVSPTWQYKDLFARANVGVAYLLNNKFGTYDDQTGLYSTSTTAFGSKHNNKLTEDVTLEAGLLF